ncbi:zinc ribbon domain-containing protein [Tengunoibacter tsumagoiensis]|uniref:Zinc-ribbon domain-containing protein n=1 Tax=Tengunoibacter tsumagoiensis TaxID=2014871 RepID=A0A402A200_9CHLR|nr:zinc ribbon domain-containing protein [Tengunoibacter tsumagoiensis]GCE13177.1 hypothetical protein KTT_30360 [Tengunoibacter tsumagoiensis]
MKPITGQYECVHSSGVGLDYFTSRIDRLVLLPNGTFTLTVQTHSRATHAAKSFAKGEQTSLSAPENRLEGSYTCTETQVDLTFANGGFEQAHLAPDGTGLQIGPNFFTKVSDSTLLPSTHRLKKDMDDIARGLKIASTIGGIAMKAAKTIQGGIQSVQGNAQNSPETPNPPLTTSTPPVMQPAPAQPVQPSIQPGSPAQPAGARFCDQCGAPLRVGKRFCNNCGARVV